MPLPLHKGRLGRGLASLIGDMPSGEQRRPAEGEQRMVGIDQLRRSQLNPRRDFGDAELAELADSIRTNGLLQPIIARPDANRGGYEIVSGERRWRAAQRAGIALIENVQRSDLNAIEEATGYNDLTERFGYTQEQLADVIGKSRSHIANTLRLLKLPPAVRSLVANGALTAGHARALVGRDDAEALAQRIVAQDLNVRAVEALQ